MADMVAASLPQLSVQERQQAADGWLGPLVFRGDQCQKREVPLGKETWHTEKS